MQQQHWLRDSSVAAMMARRPTSAESALIRPGDPIGLKGALSLLPARKRSGS
jgi:hypothetical protein